MVEKSGRKKEVFVNKKICQFLQEMFIVSELCQSYLKIFVGMALDR